jgi:hypothetical protein
MERVAAKYRADAKAAGKEARPATDTPKCEDPGAFVYPPPAAAPGTAAAAPAATGAAAAKTAAAPAAAPAKK